MTTLYSGGIRAYPGIPNTWDPDKRARAERALADARAADPAWDGWQNQDPRADIEYCWEDICRMAAAWRASGGDLQVSLRPWDADTLRHRLGPVPTYEEGMDASDRFLMHPLLKRYGGRRYQRVTFDTERQRPDSAAHWLAHLAEQGVERGVPKAAQTKGGIWFLDLDPDPDVMTRRIWDALDWAVVRLDGTEKALLAQEWIPMTHEYRLFVVDGVPVTGAGCIEEYTPLDHDSTQGAFDTRTRYDRTGGGEVASRPDLARKYVEFAARVCHDQGTFVLDLATRADTGKTIVVELNALPNSGLYASDVDALMRALITADDRGYSLVTDPTAGATPINNL